MILRILAFLIIMVCTSSARASSIDINFHSNALRATYASYVGKKTVADFGALLLKERYRKEDEVVFHTGFNFVFDNLRFGVRAIYATPGDSDILSLGFGGQVRFPMTRRVDLGGHFYYASDVTSALDSEGYQEFSVRLDFKLAQSAYLYLGYRNVKVKINTVQNKVELDDDFHIGAKLYF